jgi:hypothetical protein
LPANCSAVTSSFLALLIVEWTVPGEKFSLDTSSVLSASLISFVWSAES